MHKISIIVPVYNTEKYLRRCVDSILAQTFTDFELLLINDGSTDSSGAICDEYTQKDSRVRVFHKENGGVSSACNLGLDNARGEWITFEDSDDTLPVNALEDIYRNDSEDLIVSAFYRINSKIKTDIEWKCGTIFKDDFNNFLSLNLNNTLFRTPWAKMYRTELIHLNKIRMDESLSVKRSTRYFK